MYSVHFLECVRRTLNKIMLCYTDVICLIFEGNSMFILVLFFFQSLTLVFSETFPIFSLRLQR